MLGSLRHGHKRSGYGLLRGIIGDGFLGGSYMTGDKG